MKYAIKKGAIAKLAVVVAVVIASITPYTQAELKQQLPQCRINTAGMPLQDERNVVAGEINDKGDVIVGDVRITNIGLSLDYQQLLKEVEGLEQDLKDIPLEETVSRLNKSKIVEEKRGQLLDFKQEALRLAGTFSKIEINTERLKQVQQCFVQGKFREADAILKAEELSHDQERILSTIESKRRELDELHQQLIGNANEFLIKAQTVTMDPNNPNSFKDASRLYEQSIRSNTHFYTLFEYAGFLQYHNQYHEAERYYQDAMKRYGGELDAPTRATMLNNMAALQSDKNEYENALKSHKEALEIYRELARSNPQTYLPSIAGTINHLAHVQYQKHDFDDAVKLHQEALEIYRNLVKSNPHTYLSYVATTLNDLGLLRHKKDEFEDALKFYNEALEIYRNLAGSNPRAYLPDIAMTLNNVANLQYKKSEFEGTLKSHQEALEIYRDLALSNPQTYLSYVAGTINNLGNLHYKKDEFEDAIKLYHEALAVYRELDQSNPQSYLPDIAGTLNNLGNLHYKKKEFEDALKLYNEALDMRRKLAQSNPQGYLPDVAGMLNNLGNLQNKKNKFEDALKSYNEALEIYRKLAQSNPQTYLPYVAVTLINLSIFYQEGQPDKNVSVKYAAEALRIVTPLLEQIPATRRYAQTARQILQNLGVNIEKILAEGK